MNGMDKTGQGVGVIQPKWARLPGWHAAGLLKGMAMREGSQTSEIPEAARLKVAGCIVDLGSWRVIVFVFLKPEY